MALALSVSPRTLGVLLSSTLVLGCGNEQKKAQPTPTTPTAATGAAVTPPPTTPDAPPPVVTAPATKVELAGGGTVHALANDGKMLGHFMIANGSRLIGDIKSQLVTPRYAGFLEESTLRSLVSMALDKRAGMAQNFDIAVPMGCVVADFKLPEPAIGCTFGYRGGAKAFVSELGEQNKLPDGGGHVAAYTSPDNQTVYVDDVGGQVVVSTGKDTFTATQAYLQTNMIGRGADVHGDVEIVVYVATAFERYRDVLAPFIEQFANMNPAPPSTGNPAIDSAVAAFSSYQKRSSKQGFDRIAEISQMTVFFSVEPAGVMIGGAAFPVPGSRTAQDAAQYGGLKLDPAFAGSAPTGAMLLAAFHANPNLHQSPSAVDMRKALSEAWAPVSGRDAASIETALAAFQAENASLYDGQGLFTLGNEPGAPAAVLFSSHLQAGKSARDGWKAWTAGFTPEAVLGKEFSQYVTWKFTPDVANIDGVPVDRWTIEPGAAIAGKIASDMPADAKVMLDKVLGGPFIHIDRAEVAGTVLTTLAPKAEANFMKRAIAAANGAGNVGAEAGLTRALARDPSGVGMFAVDVKQILAMVQNMANYGANVKDLPRLGTDLGDVYATFRYSTDGTSAIEFVIAQQLIDQLKALIPN